MSGKRPDGGQGRGAGGPPGERPGKASGPPEGGAPGRPGTPGVSELEGPPAGVAERPGGLLSRIAANVVMYHDPRSLHSEQYRTCRTNLAALNRGGAPWAVVVTSSRKGEGKSVTAANLAVCLAELPATRVCLIDADFRAAAQANIFGVDNTPGLAELLTDKAGFGSVLRNTTIAKLDVMPSGDEPPSPAELLGGERFANLLSELKRRYSWIVVDTPPVNPYTDACVATSRANGALIVVRMQQTPKDMVQRAAQSLVSAGGRLLGSFLTGLPPDHEAYDYYTYDRSSTSSDRERVKSEVDRQKAKREAERRLRQQEKAYLKQQRDQEGEKQDQGPEV
jgi:polysaccharide biosynthesis transport protein